MRSRGGATRTIALRTRGALVIVLVAMAATGGEAEADETAAPPSHLAAYHLDWLNYIDPADLPPTRQATCLVDTGVTVTPDTPADDPLNGPILARVAGDGGSGEPFDTSEPALHGTRMAMTMAAPQNDWGTIGAWTQGRIISVRATRDGETTFRGEAYAGGIDQCIKVASDLGVELGAINFSLSCISPCELSEPSRELLDNRVDQAHVRGASVVAAAGNVVGGRVGVPASEPGIVAIAAGDNAGHLCADGSYDDGVAALGPACPIESADPLSGDPFANQNGGSSAATAVASTLLTALRSLRPRATWAEAEDWVRQSARQADGRRVLDGVAAARAAGLGEVVERARAREAAATAPAHSDAAVTASPTGSWGSTAGPSNSVASPHGARLRGPRPRFVAWRQGWLTVRVAPLPRHARLAIVLGVSRHVGERFVTRRRRTRMHVPRRPVQVALRCVPTEFSAASASTQVLLRRHGSRYRR